MIMFWQQLVTTVPMTRLFSIFFLLCGYFTFTNRTQIVTKFWGYVCLKENGINITFWQYLATSVVMANHFTFQKRLSRFH